MRKWVRELEVGREQGYCRSLREEHKQWAKIFGSALVLALQQDYSEIDRLARELPFELNADGEPVLKSEPLARYRKAGESPALNIYA